MSDIDYRKLLKEYMSWVRALEGTTFVRHLHLDKKMTKEGLAELKQIEKELLHE